jgi:diacylglycerol kinase family enzyme
VALTVAVLLNSRAGHDDSAQATRVAAAFKEAGCDATIQTTDGKRITADAAKALKDRVDVIVAGGGDGTVNAVASVLVGSDVALGVLPLGTLNHFAKDLGMPLDIEPAAQVIAAARTMRVDVGEVNGRCFVNNSSIGLYARLVAEREKQERDGVTKWIANAVAAARVWSRNYHRLRVTLRAKGIDRTVRTPFVFAGNNEYQLSGLELGGRRRLTAGVLHVCMAPGMSRAGVVRMIVAAVFGRIHTIEGFESFLTTDLTLDARLRKVQVSLDGEVTTLDNPLQYRIRPGALRVVVPGDEAD